MMDIYNMFVNDVYAFDDLGHYFGTIETNRYIRTENNNLVVEQLFVMAKAVGDLDEADVYVYDKNKHWAYGKIINPIDEWIP